MSNLRIERISPACARADAWKDANRRHDTQLAAIDVFLHLLYLGAHPSHPSVQPSQHFKHWPKRPTRGDACAPTALRPSYSSLSSSHPRTRFSSSLPTKPRCCRIENCSLSEVFSSVICANAESSETISLSLSLSLWGEPVRVCTHVEVEDTYTCMS